MNTQSRKLTVLGLVLIGGTALGLTLLKSNQKIGQPGIKSVPIAGKLNVEIQLPTQVSGFQSTNLGPDKIAEVVLPKDTSMARWVYTAGDGREILLQTVLMGADRTSIHKPQFCLMGGGWRIDKTESTQLRMEQPQPYDLPVMKLVTSREVAFRDQRLTQHGLFLYWFVAEDKLTASHWERVRSMARTLLSTGRLERWAYVACFAVCEPGEEALTFERMKNFLVEAVPQFQLVPAPSSKRADAGRSQ
jgi:hypothetical protein